MLDDPWYGTKYVWETKCEPSTLIDIFAQSFYECYQHIPKDELYSGYDSLKEWLLYHAQELYNSVSFKLELSDSPLRLVLAQKERHPIGFALFEMEAAPSLAYLSSLAILPGHQRQGIGKTLVFSILKRYPEIEKIVLVTRKSNLQALAFYPALGFKNSDFVHAEHDPRFWKSFEFVNAPPPKGGGC